MLQDEGNSRYNVGIRKVKMMIHSEGLLREFVENFQSSRSKGNKINS